MQLPWSHTLLMFFLVRDDEDAIQEEGISSKVEQKKDEELNDDDIEQLYGLDKYDDSDNDDEIEITGGKVHVNFNI